MADHIRCKAEIFDFMEAERQKEQLSWGLLKYECEKKFYLDFAVWSLLVDSVKSRCTRVVGTAVAVKWGGGCVVIKTMWFWHRDSWVDILLWHKIMSLKIALNLWGEFVHVRDRQM